MAETAEEYLRKIDTLVEGGLRAQALKNDKSWQFLGDILRSEASASAERITSDAYIKNHEGYLKELGKLQAIKAIFNRLETAIDLGDKGKEKKEQYKEDLKDSEPAK